MWVDLALTFLGWYRKNYFFARNNHKSVRELPIQEPQTTKNVTHKLKKDLLAAPDIFHNTEEQEAA